MSNAKTVLIVDDDHDDQEILAEVFKEFNDSYIVSFFNNGHDLLEYLRQTNDPPFLILCDINMPRFTGLDLRKAMILDPYLSRRSIPFVFYSTAANPEQVKQAFELTVQGFFLKGHTMADVKLSVRLILDYWSLSKRPVNRAQ